MTILVTISLKSTVSIKVSWVIDKPRVKVDARHITLDPAQHERWLSLIVLEQMDLLLTIHPIRNPGYFGDD